MTLNHSNAIDWPDVIIELCVAQHKFYAGLIQIRQEFHNVIADYLLLRSHFVLTTIL